MNVAKRHKMILVELEKDGHIKVTDLSERLGVSTVTIRKDLTALENKKMLFRSHGYVNLFSSLISDRHINEKEKIMVEEKLRIAEFANRLLEPNDRIIIASGTTVLAFANKINFAEPLTVITSSVKVSLTLCYRQNIEVIQLGGLMRSSSASVIGPEAENFLNDLSCNKLFISIDGLDIDYGFTTSNIGEAHLNRMMIRAAQKVIVLTDSSKFGKRGFGKICNLNQVHQIITDTNAPANAVQMIRDKGIEVTLV
jgi:DeoR family transcriptional regulator of aga operon